MKTFTSSIYSLVVLGSILTSCQSTPTESINIVDQLYKEYELDANADRAEVFLDSLDSFIAQNIEDQKFIKPYLEKGISISKTEGMLTRTASYTLPLLRLFPDDAMRKSHLLTLGDVMFALRKRHASSIVYQELAKVYPQDDNVQSKTSRIDSLVIAEENYIKYLFDRILIDPDDYGVNRAASLKYVDAVEALALVAPDDERVPTNLYTAAEVARSLRTFPKAMSLYDWLIESYPNHTKTANALFIKGFILEQDYKRSDEAKQIYEEFLQKYPNHEMAASAKFLLDNIGKSDQEILQSMEDKK